MNPHLGDREDLDRPELRGQGREHLGDQQRPDQKRIEPPSPQLAGARRQSGGERTSQALENREGPGANGLGVQWVGRGRETDFVKIDTARGNILRSAFA